MGLVGVLPESVRLSSRDLVGPAREENRNGPTLWVRFANGGGTRGRFTTRDSGAPGALRGALSAGDGCDPTGEGGRVAGRVRRPEVLHNRPGCVSTVGREHGVSDETVIL